MQKAKQATTMNDLSKNFEMWDIDSVIPYEKNVKRHPQEQIERLAEHIKKFGFDVPIVVDRNGVIIKGHGRLEACRRLGMEKVLVLPRRELSDKQAMAIRLADNQLAALGTIDLEAMAEEISAIMAIDDDFDISVEDMGFDEGDFNLDSGAEPTLQTSVKPAPISTPSVNTTQPDYTKPNLDYAAVYREVRQIICDCSDEADQEKVYNMLTDLGYSCRPLTL